MITGNKNDKEIFVTNLDSVKYFQPKDNPIVVWTGFDAADKATSLLLHRLEKALKDIGDWAELCTGKKAQHAMKPALSLKKLGKIILPISIKDPGLGVITITKAYITVPPLAMFDDLVLLGRLESAVREAIRLAGG
jgi:hypothetical protein